MAERTARRADAAPAPGPPAAPARRGPAVLWLAAVVVLAAGCLGGPRLVFEDVLAQSDASHDGSRYAVQLRGRVANAGDVPAAWVRVHAAVGHDCLTDPRDWPGFADLGDVAPGSSAPVRATFEQEGPRFTQPTLWWRLTHTDRSAPLAKGCGALPLG